MKREKRIQILRVIAMLMIVICHLVMQYDSVFLTMTGQFFNVGVYIFLLISGVLYGGREIKNYAKWFCKKMLKLLVPVYLFLLIIFILDYFLLGSFSLQSIFIYMFNVQGIFGGIQGAGHLWFLTTIMYCYLTIPCLNWFYKMKKRLIKIVLLVFITVLAIILSFINEYIGQQLFYVLVFSIGFMYGAKLKRISIKPVFLLLMMILMFAIRIVMREFLDDTVVYTTIISSLTHIMISLCFFLFIFQLKSIDRINSKLINEMDSVSYCVYIVHYPFIAGPISLMHLTFIPVVNTMLALAASYSAAKLLQISSDQVINSIFRSKK